MKKLGVLFLAAALSCGFSGFADAKGHKGDGGFRYIEQLNPEQREQAKAIFEEAKNANMELREQMKEKKAELKEAMRNANPDSAKIESLSKELGQLRGKEMAAKMATSEKLKNAGLPEMKRPDKVGKGLEGKKGEDKKGDIEEFANRRIAKLPQEKQAEARKLFDESRAATSQTREELKAKRADLDKAVESGDAASVETICGAMGELKGKLLVAKTELRQKLEKSGIPADTFDRSDKKDWKDRKHGKRDKKHERKAD